MSINCNIYESDMEIIIIHTLHRYVFTFLPTGEQGHCQKDDNSICASCLLPQPQQHPAPQVEQTLKGAFVFRFCHFC